MAGFAPTGKKENDFGLGLKKIRKFYGLVVYIDYVQGGDDFPFFQVNGKGRGPKQREYQGTKDYFFQIKKHN